MTNLEGFDTKAGYGGYSPVFPSRQERHLFFKRELFQDLTNRKLVGCRSHGDPYSFGQDSCEILYPNSLRHLSCRYSNLNVNFFLSAVVALGYDVDDK